MGTHYSNETKEKVLRLGQAGLTYSQIQQQFPIPKSTLSVWFKNAGKTPDRSRQLAHLHLARMRARETINQGRLDRIALATEIAREAVSGLDVSDKSVVKALLAMLYWAEGTKSDTSGGPKFVNTDPILASFYLRMLRAAYDIDESRIKIRIHVHSYHNQVDVIDFWSTLLRVPKSQFGKIYVKKRSTQKKFRENFHGICTIGYYETRVRRELLSLGLLIAEKHKELPSFNG